MNTNVLKKEERFIRACDYEVGYRFRIKETGRVLVVTLDVENLNKIFRPVESKYIDINKAFYSLTLDRDKVEELGEAILLTRTLKSEGFISSQVEIIIDAFDCGCKLSDFTDKSLYTYELEDKLINYLRGDKDV